MVVLLQPVCFSNSLPSSLLVTDWLKSLVNYVYHVMNQFSLPAFTNQILPLSFNVSYPLSELEINKTVTYRTQRSGVRSDEQSVLPILGKTFRPVQRKNSAAEKKIRPPNKFDCLKAFGADKDFVICVKWLGKYDISLICTELERKSGGKQIC